jgi:large subunit ribosomal protein L5
MMMDKSQNPMRQIVIDKVTLNIGVGHAGAELENAKLLLERLTGHKAIETHARVRNPVFKIKKGDPIGAKVTLRGKEALEFIKKALQAKSNRISKRSFDRAGNFSFGVAEYIDFPGMKYDPKIGIIGFDVCVTLRRRGGSRTSRKRTARSKIGPSHKITQSEAYEFVKSALGVEIA